MKPNFFQLEKLRQEIEGLEFFRGSSYDYLDHGSPDEAQQRETFAAIAAYDEQVAELRRRLEELIAGLRTAAPQVIATWCAWHSGICRRIIAEGECRQVTQDTLPGQVTELDVRLYVARETLAGWQKVLRGEVDVVSINSGYLADYSQEVFDALRENEDTAG